MSEENKKVEVEESVDMPTPPAEDVVDQLHEGTLEELESLSEEGNDANKKVLDDAKGKIDEIFKDLSRHVSDQDKDKIKENVNNAKDEVFKLLDKTKEKVQEVSESDNFKETVQSGKDFVTGAGTMLSDLFKAGTDKLMENENIKNFVDKTNEKVDSIRSSKEDADQTSQEETNEVVEQLHEEALSELDSMSEEGNTENKKVLEEARAKMDSIFKDLNQRVQGADKDKMKENVNNAKDEVFKVLNRTKEKAVEVSQSDNFKDTMKSGKDFVTGAGTMLADAFKAGADTLMKNESIKNAVETADEKFDTLRDSEGLKNAIDKAEEVTGKVSETIFGAIKNFLEPKERVEKETEQVDSNEENNDL